MFRWMAIGNMKLLFLRLNLFRSPRWNCNANASTLSSSSQKWLRRQRNDPYVKKAQELGYRARSAFKLLEMDDRFKILRAGMSVVECGAAPGAWTQVAADRVNAGGAYRARARAGTVVACDLLAIQPLTGAETLSRSDFTLPETQERILKLLNGRKADVVLSDMAPNASGQGGLDSSAQLNLAAAALRFAVLNSIPGERTAFLCKVWNGKGYHKFKEAVQRFYSEVHEVKPKSSRQESMELFVLGRNFKGAEKIDVD